MSSLHNRMTSRSDYNSKERSAFPILFSVFINKLCHTLQPFIVSFNVLEQPDNKLLPVFTCVTAAINTCALTSLSSKFNFIEKTLSSPFGVPHVGNLVYIFNFDCYSVPTWGTQKRSVCSRSTNFPVPGLQKHRA